jgi:transposase
VESAAEVGVVLQKKSIHAAEQDRPDVAERRAAWRASQAGLDPLKLVFIDETWAKTNMTRLRGRSPVGQRLVAKVPFGHWKTTTLIAALDYRGMRCSMSLDGAVNGEAFEAFVEQVLISSLSPGDLVVMDNLSSHKGARVRELIQTVDAKLLYLPPYSPDLNPIEPAFSKLKQLLRSAAHRTVGALWSDVQRMLDQITTSDAIGFFRHCGYTLQVK